MIIDNEKSQSNLENTSSKFLFNLHKFKTWKFLGLALIILICVFYFLLDLRKTKFQMIGKIDELKRKCQYVIQYLI